MLNALCLSFIALGSASAPHIPQHVDGIVKSHLLRELQAARPDMQFSFDSASQCSNTAQYLYHGDSLVITGAGAAWPSRVELNLTDLIDGRKLDFAFLREEKLQPEAAAPAPMHQPTAAASKKESRRWLPVALAVVGAGVLGGIIAAQSSSGGSAAPEAVSPRLDLMRLQH